jgi:hypothetical protein
VSEPAPSACPVGSTVVLSEPQPYLKTADAMPMLRPGDLVSTGEEGEVMSLLPKDQRAVRFRRGSFVVPLSALQETESS